MNLAELIDYVGKEYLDDRTDLLIGDDDSLWSDAFIVRQLNHAQRILCRRAWCIIETGVAPAGVIILQTGKETYSLHKSVLRVFDATPTTQTEPLGRANDIDLRSPYPLGADAFDIGVAASLGGSTAPAPGAPLAFASDAGTRTLRVYPAPAADQNGLRINLKVARLPVTELTLDDMDADPEVPEDWHLDLCTYAAGRCLVLPPRGGESSTRNEGRDLLAEFAGVVQEARRDRQRAFMGSDRWAFNSTTALI